MFILQDLNEVEAAIFAMEKAALAGELEREDAGEALEMAERVRISRRIALEERIWEDRRRAARRLAGEPREHLQEAPDARCLFADELRHAPEERTGPGGTWEAPGRNMF
jgi:hypothetical protein